MRPRSRFLPSLRLSWLAVVSATLLWGCASWRGFPGVDPQALLPAAAILLGEQHDAPDHQKIQAQVVRTLARQDQLAALAVEMAERGHDTRALSRRADEAQVREALQWNDQAWPWAQYGPAVMAAVRAGVPVLGANLPRTRFSSATLDPTLERSLPADALAAQHEAIRIGHCDLLAPSQIGPMTRIQIARDQAMAQTLQAAARPGQVVVLLAGSGHVDRDVGVPRHLPPGFKVQAVRLLAGAQSAAPSALPAFDAIWTSPAVAAKDHCAELRSRIGK